MFFFFKKAKPLIVIAQRVVSDCIPWGCSWAEKLERFLFSFHLAIGRCLVQKPEDFLWVTRMLPEATILQSKLPGGRSQEFHWNNTELYFQEHIYDGCISNKLTRILLSLFNSAFTVALLHSELCARPLKSSGNSLQLRGFLDPELDIWVRAKSKAGL